MKDDFSAACDIIDNARRVLLFTGAGISTESGIPDFRGPDGLWSRVDPADFTIGRYLSDPELRKRRWRMHLDGELWGSRSVVRPNRAHHAITDLWRAEKLSGVVTQNIDGLHQEAGVSDDHVAELHGNIRRANCVGCGEDWATTEVLARVEAGEADPSCPTCGDIIKTSTVMFGEALPMNEWGTALVMAAQAEAVLVVGSTLGVFPAADVALEPARRGVPMVIVNLGPTDYDHLARVKLDGMAGELVPQLADVVLGH
ncbi:MAG: Sir2 family NAD-dependent protein deacetylase [Acidimicrobiia bacterium]|nr:Sir2 family NAD-dependent protein deacetylase [Acidimicrobiia bacterium]